MQAVFDSYEDIIITKLQYDERGGTYYEEAFMFCIDGLSFV